MGKSSGFFERIEGFAALKHGPEHGDAAARQNLHTVDFHPEVTRVFHRELTRLKVMFCGSCGGRDLRDGPPDAAGLGAPLQFRGPGGLVTRTVPHRPRRLMPNQLTEFASWVEAGPDPVRDGVVRWRRKDLQHRIAAFGVVLHERGVGKQLAALGFRRLSVRPPHPKSDPGGRVAFKKTSPKR